MTATITMWLSAIAVTANAATGYLRRVVNAVLKEVFGFTPPFALSISLATSSGSGRNPNQNTTVAES